MKNILILACLIASPAVSGAQVARVELDHVFIAVPASGRAEADALQKIGFTVDTAVTRHEGQGTASRSALFENMYVELIWVDSSVRVSEEARPLLDEIRRAVSWRSTGVSPFGLGLRRTGGPEDYGVPTARYSAEWMEPGTFILVLKQSDEPQAADAFVVPAYMALPAWIEEVKKHAPASLLHSNGAKRISAVTLAGPTSHRPAATRVLNPGGLSFVEAETPTMTLEFDSGVHGTEHDLRPLLPVIIRR